MLLRCYKEQGRPIWLDDTGRVWNFHPLKKTSSLAGGLGAFRIGTESNSSFMKRIREKVHKAIPSKAIKPSIIQSDVIRMKPAFKKIPFGLPQQMKIPRIGQKVSDVMPLAPVPFGLPDRKALEIPSRGYLPHHRTQGANTGNDEQMQLAVEAQPQQDRGLFLPSNRSIAMSQSAQDSQQRQGNGFGNELLDRFKNGDVDIAKTVTDIKSIVDAFKGGNPSNPNPTPVYIPVDRGGGGTPVSEKNDNLLLYLAAGGVLLIGGAILMKDK